MNDKLGCTQNRAFCKTLPAHLRQNTIFQFPEHGRFVFLHENADIARGRNIKLSDSGEFAFHLKKNRAPTLSRFYVRLGALSFFYLS